LCATTLPRCRRTPGLGPAALAGCGRRMSGLGPATLARCGRRMSGLGPATLARCGRRMSGLGPAALAARRRSMLCAGRCMLGRRRMGRCGWPTRGGRLGRLLAPGKYRDHNHDGKYKELPQSNLAKHLKPHHNLRRSLNSFSQIHPPNSAWGKSCCSTSFAATFLGQDGHDDRTWFSRNSVGTHAWRLINTAHRRRLENSGGGKNVTRSWPGAQSFSQLLRPRQPH
jgi:hypothetical protein